MSPMIYLDIETIPGQQPWAREEAAVSVKPPGTLKKAESLAAWERDEKPQAIEEAYARTGLDAAIGQVYCIGWAVDDGEPEVSRVADLTMGLMSEADVLEDFFDAVRRVYSGTHGTRPIFCGHNVTGFDLPFLYRRAVVCGIKPPPCLPRNPAPWDDYVRDTMTMWAGNRDRISLDKLCRALGIAGKGDGPTGADVWPMVQAGRGEEVAEYCKQDVIRARAIYKRLVFAD